MTKDIRVKGKNQTRLPGTNPFVVMRNHSHRLPAMVYLLCQTLELPCLEHLSQYAVPENVPDVYTEVFAQLEIAPDQVLHSALDLMLVELETVHSYFQRCFLSHEESKWLADYEAVYPIFLPKLKEVIEQSEEVPQALLELFSFYYFLEERHALVALVPWYIRYAPVEDITDERLLNVLAKPHHDEYIARLPSDELFEFLTSDEESARVRAKNKVKMDAMGEFDEAV